MSAFVLSADNIGPSGLHERRLGRTMLRTYRTVLDIDNIVPNERQPRLGPKEDKEMQRQIHANNGLFEPLLVEPHPHLPGKFRIIDGDRRWTNSQILVAKGHETLKHVPAEVTDRTLTDDERLRAWIYIHRQRKEWDAKEKEMVAYRLVDIVGRASAANILGMTVRELDKLVEVFKLSERFKDLSDPSAAITWARELMSINKDLLTASVMDAVALKISQKRITNSKELRKLRTILRDPVAKAHFLSEEGDIDSALQRMRIPPKMFERIERRGLLADVSALCKSIRSYSWTELGALRGDEYILEKVREAAELLESLSQMLRSNKLAPKSEAPGVVVSRRGD